MTLDNNLRSDRYGVLKEFRRVCVNRSYCVKEIVAVVEIGRS